MPDKQNFRAYHYNKHPTDIPKKKPANIYFEGGKLIVKVCVRFTEQAVTPVKRPIDAKAELFVQYSDLSETLEYSDAHSASDIAPSDIWNIQEVRVISDYIYKINKFWLVWWFGRICMPTNIMCIPNIMTNHRIIARKYYEHQKIWNRFKMTIYKQSNL